MNDSAPDFTRRSFLWDTGLALVATGLGVKRARAERDHPLLNKVPNVLDKVAETGFTDENDKVFTRESLDGKPFIMMFGYGGCSFCSYMSDTLILAQQKFGSDVPIYFVTTKPDQDRPKLAEDGKEKPETLKESFEKKRDIAVLVMRDGEVVRDKKHLGLDTKNFHVLYAKDRDEALKFHDNFDIRNKNHPDNHSGNFYICNGDGKVTDIKFAAYDEERTTERQLQVDRIATSMKKVSGVEL